MLLTLKLFHFVLLLFATAQYPWRVTAADECEIINRTTTENLPLHKYRVLENCIYTAIRDEYTKTHDGESFIESPPFPRSDSREFERLEVTIKSTMITDIKVTDTTQSLYVSGQFGMQWNDMRLKWDEEKLRRPKIKIESMGSIWVPDMSSEDPFATSGSMGVYMRFSEINVTSSGMVTAMADFTLTSDRSCVWTMEDYPNDKVSCCEKFISTLYADRIQYVSKRHTYRFELMSDTVELHKSWKFPSWSFVSSSVKLQSRPGKIQTIQICTAMQRDAKNLRVRMTVPMAVAAIVGLVAPLHPNLKSQLHVKLFALLLQFLTFQFLVDNNQQINVTDKTPRMYKFYEFTLAITLLNILISFITMALCKCKSRIPPPHSLTLFAKAVGSCLCCPMAAKAESSATEADATNDDWETVWLALSSLSSILLALIYIIGIIIIAA